MTNGARAGRVELGTWNFPSGNSCDVTYERGERDLRRAYFAWDDPPPLKHEDLDYYLRVVLPEVIRLVMAIETETNRVER